jgi:hypothetical protein
MTHSSFQDVTRCHSSFQDVTRFVFCAVKFLGFSSWVIWNPMLLTISIFVSLLHSEFCVFTAEGIITVVGKAILSAKLKMWTIDQAFVMQVQPVTLRAHHAVLGSTVLQVCEQCLKCFCYIVFVPTIVSAGIMYFRFCFGSFFHA